MAVEGYIHIYTGNGKGKTTSALGLALRAAGAGQKVCILQFMKGRPGSEHRALERFNDMVTVELMGHEDFYLPGEGKKDMHAALARKGLDRSLEVLKSGKYFLVVLDEVITAIDMGLINEADVITLMREKPEKTELVLTGRGATDTLIQYADLVTDMRQVSHYYEKGVTARPGIEQ